MPKSGSSWGTGASLNDFMVKAFVDGHGFEGDLAAALQNCPSIRVSVYLRWEQQCERCVQQEANWEGRFLLHGWSA